MVSNCTSGRNSRLICGLYSGLAVALLALAGGCPEVVEPPDDGGNPPGQTQARIISPASSFGLSLLDEPISVIYTVPASATEVSGYYVPVEGSAPNSPPSGTPVVIAENLAAGENRVFSFSPNQAGTGFFRVGVNYTISGQQLFVESQGVIQVQGSPVPRFVQPDQPVTSVEQGDEVFISFNAGDPEGAVSWRLFRLGDGDSTNTPADQLGTQLAAGTGNSGTYRLNTAALLLGDYRLGLSATDSGFSVAATVNRGESARIITIPNDSVTTPVIRVVAVDVLKPPTIVVTAPGAGGVALFRDDPFQIKFDGDVFEAGGDRSIEVFRDNDSVYTNGVTIIEDDLAISATTLALPTNLPEGTYFIGATIRDGVTAPVTAYAPGQIRVVRNVTLAVNQPSSPLPVTPGTTVTVAWNTNAPASAGTVSAFAQVADNDGNGTGPEIPILTDAPLTTTSARFTSAEPGRFRITVRIDVRDGTNVVASAPALVRFSSLPGIVWLGSLADPDGEIEGAIFGGANFEDNAGSGVATAGDLNDDGPDDFVVAARYGKPDFVNPSGIGPGEGYLIFGASGGRKLRGEYNLNSVGTSVLPGVTLAGVPTSGMTSQTDGLSDVTPIPDVDGDGKPEVVFSFPNTESGPRTLCRPGQFNRGGLVILSSINFDNVIDFDVIHLDDVGQVFTDSTVAIPVEEIFDDFFEFREADPDNNISAGCVAGSDGIADTIIGPGFGFTSELACPVWELIPGFLCFLSDVPGIQGATILPAGPPPVCRTTCRAPGEEDEGLCRTRYFTPCAGGGSGFYPEGSLPTFPRGARIIGKEENDRYGTSVAVIEDLENPGLTDLVVSAPGRTATGGEVRLLCSTPGPCVVEDAGVAYLVPNQDLWAATRFADSLPAPHQYLAGGGGFCSGQTGRNGDIGVGPHIAGQEDDKIEIIEAAGDFNDDGRNDFAIGAPDANSGNGRVYIAFRRAEQIEGDYVMRKLGLHPQNNERLTGMLLTAMTEKNLGFSLASGFDFNDDGHSDLVIGAPLADQEVGEVYIVFGNSGVITGEGGENIEDLLSSRTADGGPVVARIKGNPADKGLFGFNVANGGDIDNDGTDDLLISAPHAAPRFDPNPNDNVDELTRLGIDLDEDGVADNVPGDDRLLDAGLVYVIYGSNRLDQMLLCSNSGKPCEDAEDCDNGESCGNKNFTIGVKQLGTSSLAGFMIAGRREGDRIGGGDAGQVSNGGIASKVDRGRSFGVGGAGDVDGDGRADILIGSVIADPRRDPTTQIGIQNGGEAYLLYGTAAP